MSDKNIPGSIPFVSLIIPVTGASPVLASNLKTLINQDYQFFHVIFVLQDKNDPAASIISQITKDYNRVTHIFSGKAISCSQKNHNLLAGIQEAGSKPDILVFCDSGHIAPTGWLTNLLQPLLSDSSCMVSSGYHQIYPENHCICSQGRAICVLTLSLIRKLPFLGQPWGGATAIRRETFETIAVAETWDKNIVDDVSLAKLLQMRNIPVIIPDRSDLETYLRDTGVANWIIWLTRQWAYLKFIFPVLWLATGVLTIAATVSVYAALLLCITRIFFPVPQVFLQHSLSIVIPFLLFTGFLYFRHPAPGSVFTWFPASLAALTMAAYCHIKTWLTKTLCWASIQYHVGKHGKVTRIIREKKDIRANG